MTEVLRFPHGTHISIDHRPAMQDLNVVIQESGVIHLFEGERSIVTLRVEEMDMLIEEYESIRKGVSTND